MTKLGLEPRFFWLHSQGFTTLSLYLKVKAFLLPPQQPSALPARALLCQLGSLSRWFFQEGFFVVPPYFLCQLRLPSKLSHYPQLYMWTHKSLCQEISPKYWFQTFQWLVVCLCVTPRNTRGKAMPMSWEDWSPSDTNIHHLFAVFCQFDAFQIFS